jgi:hypothetical protein
MTRSPLTSLLLALAGPLAAGAQQVTVSGVVVYGSPPASVGGATVRLSGSGAYFTDLDGWFRFEHVPPGPHTLTVQALGYRTRSLDLVIAADTILAVELEPDPVAIRLLERQVERLETRSRSVPYAIDEAGREDIRMSGVAMIGELVRRRLPPGTVGNRPPYGDLPSIVYHGGGLGRPVCR